jgi:hypothetical protein
VKNLYPGDLVTPYDKKVWPLAQLRISKEGAVTALGVDLPGISYDGYGIVVAAMNDNGSAYHCLYVVFSKCIGWVWDDVLQAEKRFPVDVNENLT